MQMISSQMYVFKYSYQILFDPYMGPQQQPVTPSQSGSGSNGNGEETPYSANSNPH